MERSRKSGVFCVVRSSLAAAVSMGLEEERHAREIPVDTEEERTRAELWKRLSEQSRGEIVGLLVRLLVQSEVERAGTETQKEYEP